MNQYDRLRHLEALKREARRNNRKKIRIARKVTRKNSTHSRVTGKR